MNMSLKNIMAMAVAVLCVAAVSCKKEIDSQGTKYVKVTDIRLNTGSMTIIIGDEQQLVAKVYPNKAYDKKVNWTSSNSYAASVDENGLVKGLHTGNTTITATSSSNKNISASCEVQVVVTPIPIEGLSFRQSDYVVQSGSTVSVYPVFTPTTTTQRNLQWTSSDNKIAKVNETGTVEGIKNGSVTITVKSLDNPSVTASVPVRVVEPFTSISIDWPNTSLSWYNSSGAYYEKNVGDSFTLSVSTQPSTTGDRLVYRSSDATVASVSEDGVVTARKGSSSPVTIFVGCETGNVEEKSIKLRVYDAPTSLKFEITDVPGVLKTGSARLSEYIGVGATQKYYVSVLPTSANQKLLLQSWTSNLTCEFKNGLLTVTAKDNLSTSTSSNKVSAIVRMLAGGKEIVTTFYISEFDPYQPKPGDGLWQKSENATTHLYSQDSGWRGADIWEDPVTVKGNNSNVVAMIGHVGSEWCTEDTKAHNHNNVALWTGIYKAAAGYKRGIAIPVNASKIYASGGNTNHSGGMPFSLDPDDLSTQTDLLTSSNRKHTAYANGDYIRIWNKAREGSKWRLQIMPNFYCDYNSLPNNAGSGWYYGASTSTELNATAPGELLGSLASTWIMPTMADLVSVFRGSWPATTSSSSINGYIYGMTDSETMEKAKARIAAFKKAAKMFGGVTINSYNNNWWLAQQQSTANGLIFNVNDNGQIYIRFVDKTTATSNYVLPILYY